LHYCGMAKLYLVLMYRFKNLYSSQRNGRYLKWVQLRNIVETVLNKNKKSNPGVRLPTPPNSSFITYQVKQIKPG